MELKKLLPSRFEEQAYRQEARDVISINEVLAATRLDVEYFRGCCHGLGGGMVIGAAIVGALCYFFG